MQGIIIENKSNLYKIKTEKAISFIVENAKIK